MAGQRNGKTLRLLVGLAGLAIVLYILYSIFHLHNQLKLKNQHLKLAEEESEAMSKRFDLLSSELKSILHKSADFEKQLQNEKKAHLQTTREKEEVGRLCRAEQSRNENQKNQLAKEKHQLNEEKDQFKRERDRFSSRLDALTQECTDAKNHATDNEHRLQRECDVKIDHCNSRVASLDSDLGTCRDTLLRKSDSLTSCNTDLLNERQTSDRYHSQLLQLEQLDSNNQRERNNLPRGVSERKDHQDSQQQYIPRENKDDSLDPNPWHGNRPHPQNSDNRNLHNLVRRNNGYHSPGAQQNNQSHLRNRQDMHQEPQHDHYSEPGGVDEVKAPLPNKENHIDESKKRNVFNSLHKKILNGDILTEKEQKLYSLLTQYFGEDIGGHQPSHHVPEGEVKDSRNRDHIPSNAHHQDPVVQEPPVPGIQNEQEEVKDLVDGQQKAGEFDNARVEQGNENIGGAGGQEEERDEGVELVEGEERRNRHINPEARDAVGLRQRDNPIQNQIQDPAMGGVNPAVGGVDPAVGGVDPAVGGVDQPLHAPAGHHHEDNGDGDDGDEYVAMDNRNRAGANVDFEVNNGRDEGERAYDQEMYEERKRLLHRNHQEEANENDIEKDPHQVHQVPNPAAHREIR